MSPLERLSLSVVIPAFNEEHRIAKAIRSICCYLASEGADFELLVVDDGSWDRTAAVVEKSVREFPNTRLVQLSRNYGKGRAVKEGVLRARGDFILFTDADQSTSIEQLPNLLGPMREDGCQVAIGSRAVKGAILIRRQAWFRESLGKLFGVIMRCLLLRGVMDPQCGFKCFTREAAHAIFSEVTCNNALFDMEAMLLAARKGYRVAEVPVCWVHDPDSRLVYSVGGSLRLLRELFRIRRHWQVRIPVKVHRVGTDSGSTQGGPRGDERNQKRVR